MNSDLVSAHQEELRDTYELRAVEHIDYKQNIEMLVHDEPDHTKPALIAKCIKFDIKEHVEKIVMSYRTDIKVRWSYIVVQKWFW